MEDRDATCSKASIIRAVTPASFSLILARSRAVGLAACTSLPSVAWISMAAMEVFRSVIRSAKESPRYKPPLFSSICKLDKDRSLETI